MPRTGYKQTDEHKQKHSLAKLGNKNAVGHTISAEFVRAIGRKGLDTRWKDHVALTNTQQRQRRRAIEFNAEGSHTLEEWLLLKELYQNMCLCCKRQEPEIKLTQDHIVPLSLGGTDYIENIQPLCMGCNRRKYLQTIDYRSSDSQVQILN